MKEKLNELAERLIAAISTDTPRQTMYAVITELRILANGMEVDGSTRDDALALASKVTRHQYGLRGFGDGSLSRGRDLTRQEQQVIVEALRAYGTASTYRPPLQWQQTEGLAWVAGPYHVTERVDDKGWNATVTYRDPGMTEDECRSVDVLTGGSLEACKAACEKHYATS